MDELLKVLKKNALETPENIAKMLNISSEEVEKNIKKYEEEGVIKGYQAIINEDELDLDCVRAVIEIKITPEREGGFNKIAERIGKFPQVDSLFLMSGAYDLLAFVSGDNLKEVASFVSAKLATIEGVVSTGTHFMLKAYKDQGILMTTEDEHERLKVTP
jgi:DNA-binding Lrp family transcriptional regulator